MPTERPVSIKWQIVFAIISPLNIWAFYRIKKLRLFVLCVLVPSIIIAVITGVMMYKETISYEAKIRELEEKNPSIHPPYMTPIEPQAGMINLIIINLIVSIGFTIFAVYLIIKWSRRWNLQFAN